MLFRLRSFYSLYTATIVIVQGRLNLLEMADDEKKAMPAPSNGGEKAEPGMAEAEMVNTSGHVQEMDRSFGFWSLCAIAIL